MAFKLRITFTGLCVFMPDNVTTDVILPSTPGAHHSAHTANATMTMGVQRQPFVPLPLKLTRHDLYLYDGPNRIAAAVGGGPPHAFPNYPTLLPSVGNPPHPKPGVRPPQAIAAVCAARMRLFDGEFFGQDPTIGCWHLVDETDTDVPGTEMDPMFNEFRYERTIEADYGQLECVAAGQRAVLLFEPDGGEVYLEIGNRAHVNPLLTPGKDRSPHFPHVYLLFDQVAAGHELEECDVHEDEPPRFTPRSLNLPCVGGCTC